MVFEYEAPWVRMRAQWSTTSGRRCRTGGTASEPRASLIALILFSAAVILVYALLVGSPHVWFHALGPVAIAMVVAFSLVVLFDLSYPFSGDVRVDPGPFKTGALAPFFDHSR